MICDKEKVVKKILHWFNPWNDLALAFGGENYTPPKAGQELARKMSWLPILWAEEGDMVAFEGDLPDWVARLPLKGSRWDGKWDGIGRVEPWGWSLAARKQLRKMGAPESILPTDELLYDWRMLSHRRTTEPFLRLIYKWGATEKWFRDRPLPLLPREERSCPYYTAAAKVVKAPWSTAGRGILDSTTMSWEDLRRKAEGIINRQGSVMIEARLDKVLDFALLYRSTDAGVEYLGPSLFMTEKGVYRGGKIAPAGEMEAEIAAFVTSRELEWVKEAARKALEAIRTDYRGFIGVDMMVHRLKDGTLAIHPCVEINWRATMGLPALMLGKMGERGWFKPEL
ncbi:MAG: hypothetical protein LIP02_11890 [Bacteroidales bacterium]|nr:hypothetical protein [Bacteroidales bacterium]